MKKVAVVLLALLAVASASSFPRGALFTEQELRGYFKAKWANKNVAASSGYPKGVLFTASDLSRVQSKINKVESCHASESSYHSTSSSTSSSAAPAFPRGALFTENELRSIQNANPSLTAPAGVLFVESDLQKIVNLAAVSENSVAPSASSSSPVASSSVSSSSAPLMSRNVVIGVFAVIGAVAVFAVGAVLLQIRKKNNQISADDYPQALLSAYQRI
eukprot:GILI01004538.1.p2 GENE.GILI01004538.1~~GILI01004538.1.p2  ORF type:complete len:218 (+),score=89.85 GILI01004538.1:51-704(+)